MGFGWWVVGGCTYSLGSASSVTNGFLYYAQTFYCKGYLRIQEENIYPVQQVPVHPEECEHIFVQQLVYMPKTIKSHEISKSLLQNMHVSLLEPRNRSTLEGVNFQQCKILT